MIKPNNIRAPGTLDGKGGRMGVKGTEVNLKQEAVLKSRNHALAKKSNPEMGRGEMTPERKFENQEGEFYFSPAKRRNLNLNFEDDLETWTKKMENKPSVEIE